MQEEQDNVQNLRVDREQTIKDAMRQVEEMGKELTHALRAVAAAESRAAVAEVIYLSFFLYIETSLNYNSVLLLLFLLVLLIEIFS